MTPDEQEALSRKHSNDVIILLPLSSGNIAVFNSARELCGILPTSHGFVAYQAAWHPPGTDPTPFQNSLSRITQALTGVKKQFDDVEL